ncbi:hypothetical protein CRE_16735 [Caenorhabditis remanei]|uniref:Carboxylic ester hydrolase n=1 Tax=Caenorhabditis remanei TaxID=31234 RepID=E3MAQ5_CAERE|nr:hypothetical protein CRE_16735 [Caenorhabditis remanei]
MIPRTQFVCLLLSLIELSDSKLVKTSYGTLEGSTVWSEDKNHKYTFKSVPFAKPPLGKLRFALPEVPDTWHGIRDASNYSAACMSKQSKRRPNEVASEDCLYINIFSSERCLVKKCPVIVYYHGGAFHSNSAVMFPDDFILERYVSEDIVFTIPAFRLGVFGQLYFGRNNQLKENLLHSTYSHSIFDAVRALEYVNTEIANFGGDPNRVTIMGHSTGGTMIDALGFSQLIDPEIKLFQQIIGLSAPGDFGYEELAVESSLFISKKLGCFSGNLMDFDLAPVLNCMRNMNAIDILKMQIQMTEEDGMNFTRIIKGAPFMELGGKLSEFKKTTPSRSLLFGTTEHEFVFADPYIAGHFLDLENPTAVYKYFDNIVMNQSWSCIVFTFKNTFSAGIFMKHDSAAVFVSTATYSEAMVNTGADVFVFETTQKPFSAHVTDMQYFIGLHREVVHYPDMDLLDYFYSKFLANFTKYGCPSPLWPKYDPVRMNYLKLEIDTELGITPKMEDNFNRKIVEFWLNDMVQLDRNISEQKTKTIGSERSKELQLSNENFRLYKQRWFYAATIIFCVMFFMLFKLLKKPKSDECKPLISH